MIIIFVPVKNDFMKRLLLILLLSSILIPFSEAQLWKLKRIEISAGLGPSQFFGDVGGYSHGINMLGIRDMSFLQTRYNVNLNLKYRIRQDVSLRVSLASGLLHATDQRGSNEGREFETSTGFFESALMGEYYFIKNTSEDSYLFNEGRGRKVSRLLKSLDCYIFTGVGGLSYKVTPNARLLHHGLDPKGFTAIVPLGIGATMTIFPSFSFGIELGGRYAFSDNLDGYTSQYSSSNDVYYFLNLTVTYRLKFRKHILPSFR